jgi:hypothetical protein
MVKRWVVIRLESARIGRGHTQQVDLTKNGVRAELGF